MKKLLIISHNVFSTTENMGKTLSSYFKGFEPENIAQIYIHSEIPTTDVCFKYYRITDADMIKSVITRRTGRAFKKEDISHNRKTPRIETGIQAKLYQAARKRSPLLFFARNLWWSLGRWKTKKLQVWLDEYSPDAVFFASGDFKFMYKIALKIASDRNIPLYVSCMDDYYIYENHFGSEWLYKSFMKQVNKTISYSSGLFCICDSMNREYSKKFNKKCYTLYTATSLLQAISCEKKNSICYIGNVGLKRNLQLIYMGRVLKSLNLPIDHIDIYSSETRKEILRNFTINNGIEFHGAVSAEEVKKIMYESKALIHTESFDRKTRELVKFSVSTKIPDYLSSGTCILTFGPSDIESISYLKSHGVALCAQNEEELKRCFIELFRNEELIEEITSNALALAQRNHSMKQNTALLKLVLFPEYTYTMRDKQ